MDKDKLIEKINNLPIFNAKLDGIEYSHLPLSDHRPILLQTRFGPICAFNLWCPGARIGPPFIQNHQQIHIGRLDKSYHLEKLSLQAEYLLELFQLGLSLMAIQEMPLIDTPNGQHFLSELKAGDGDCLDLTSLKASCIQTSKNQFATAIALNPKAFKTIDKSHIKRQHDNRSIQYQLNHVNSECLMLNNLHSDYLQHEKTTAFILECLKQNEYVLGDFNIEQASDSAIELKTKANGILSAPTPLTTLDGILIGLNNDSS